MNASDVLREYKDYLKIIERRNGNPADIEKAKIIIEALEQQISSKSLDSEEERLQEVVYYPNFAETKETVANMKNWIDLGYRVHTCFVRQAEVVVVYEKVRYPWCKEKAARDAIDLINRQKAEISVLRKLLDKAETEMNNQTENIKKLTKDCYSMQSTLAKMSMGVAEARAEAIKEFAERLKENTREFGSASGVQREVDNLVKEMTEPSLLDKKFGGDAE